MLDSLVNLNSPEIKSYTPPIKVELNSNTINKNEINLDFLEKSKIDKTSKTNYDSKTNIYESNISNVNFSYDREAQEFVVKVEKNNKTFQYPSDDLLKMKKYIIEENKKLQEVS